MGNLKAANSKTVLGALWWVLNPMLLAGIYFLVFGVIFGGRRGDPTYLVYLMSGMFPFHFTSRAMSGGAQSITGNGKLLVNLRFPRLILPISGLIESTVGFMASLGVYFLIISPLARNWPGLHTFSLLWIVPLHLFMTLGISGLSARFTVPFRDLSNLLPYLTRLWLYLSPIIWTVDQIDNTPPIIQNIMKLNPMFSVLAVYRHAMRGDALTQADALVAVAWCVGLGALGIYSFVRNESKMVRYL